MCLFPRKINTTIDRKTFKERYPHVNIDDFAFRQIYTDSTRTKIDRVDIFYRHDGRMYNIKSSLFKKKFQWVLGWRPRVWNNLGTVQDCISSSYSKNPNKFFVYVTETGYFPSGLQNLNITNDQTKFFTFDNPYFVACCAAYVSTYLCGISTQHMSTKESNLVSSIAKYHLYYHMRIFLRTPQKLHSHMTDDHKAFVQKHVPVKYDWKWKFDQTKERLDLWLFKQPIGSVKDYYTSTSKYGGQIGIHYMKRLGRTVNSLDDYKLFVAEKSTGLTSLGQLLFQQSIESFVYSVLGAKASTRWSIIDQGANSLQGQVIFRKLVNDTVVESEQTVIVNNMRKAIVDTNVILNTAISPGMILIPSDMIILKNKIPGFNNILTIADPSMKFGKNSDVNRVKRDVQRSVENNDVRDVTQKNVTLGVGKSSKTLATAQSGIPEGFPQTQTTPQRTGVLQRTESNSLMTLLPVSAIGGLIMSKFLF